MNEEFAIKLKMMLDQSSIAEVKKQLHDIGQEASESAQATMPKPEATEMFDIENMEEAEKHYWEILQIQTKIADFQTTLSMADVLGLSSQEIIDLNVEIEKLKNKIASLTKGGGADVSVFSKTTVMIKNNLKQVRRSIMSIVGGLIGARSIYMSIRKAMSAYLAQNDELQAKLNGAWYALGSLFAPILEKIISWFTYLVSLVDALVKSLGLAGVNMAKYGKAGAKASKQVAGFDEINNLNSQSGGGAGGGFDLDPVSDEALNKFKSILAIVSAIGAGILAWKVANSVNDLFKAFGKDGLDPVQIAGIGLAVGGVTLAIMSLINYLNDPSWLNFGLIIAGIGTAIAGLGMIIGSTPLIIAGVVTAILGILAMFWPQISAGIDWIVAYIDEHLESLKDWLTYWLGAVGTLIGGAIDIAWELVKGVVTGIQTLLDGLFRGAKQILDGIIQIFRGDFKNGISNVLQGLLTIAKGVLNGGIAVVNGFLSAISRGINFMIDMINSVKFDVPSWVPFIGGSHIGFNISHVGTWQIPSLDVGTNYVPNDMMAQLHEGEAVIPKEFNEDQYSNTEETNDLLRELINVVGSKEFKAYISQREVGESAVKYINSQSRIMGGSVV